MKLNEPNTDHERVMGDDEIIVSRTNLKGAITYCNKTFRDVSLYSDAELIGKNHNLVRHPDVPPVAFEDLWNDIQAGRPWVGIVKNRAKNGDFYWVEANVSPVFSNGQIVEYLSVRAKPSREQVAAAEAAYRAINTGQIKLGVVPWCKLPVAWLYRQSITARVIASQLLFVSLVVAAVFLSHAPGNEKLHDGVLILLALLLSGFTLWFMKDLMSSLKAAMAVMGRIRDGHYRDQVDIKRQDEIGKLYQELKMMQINMWNHLAESRERGDEAMRIKQALDHVSANVMVADTNHNIIYINESLRAMFKNAQTDIRKDLPAFDVDKLIGSNIDVYHKKPDAQRNIVSQLTGAHEASLEIGGRTMQFIANPVLNDRNQRLGTVVEWKDRTGEVAIQKEVDGIVAAAQQGDLEKRILLEGKSGFYYQISGRINLLIGVIEESFNDMARVMNAMAVGDLTAKITEEYGGKFGEVKNSINQTMSNLDSMMQQINEASEFIRESSKEIVAGNNNLSQRAEQQATTLEETASSMEEITSTVKNNAENAQLANQKTSHACMLAEKGGEVVNYAVMAMDKISASSTRISEIIGVIDEIAFQTNLLALNASVEAARAGDQGRGFAVVASEVRNLAQRSAAAAKEIKELIRDSVAKVENGAELVVESGNKLHEIVVSVKEVGGIVDTIAKASLQQTAGIDEVNKAIKQLDEITRQNAALAEQAAASSDSSLQKVSEMHELVSFFKVSAGS